MSFFYSFINVFYLKINILVFYEANPFAHE